MKTAVIHFKFDPDLMIDQATLDKKYGGDWVKMMRQMYDDEGMGIFEDAGELVDVI